MKGQTFIQLYRKNTRFHYETDIRHGEHIQFFDPAPGQVVNSYPPKYGSVWEGMPDENLDNLSKTGCQNVQNFKTFRSY